MNPPDVDAAMPSPLFPEGNADGRSALHVSMFQHAPLGMGVVDREFRLVQVNNVLAKMIPHANPIGMTVQETAPKLWAMVEPLLLRAMMGETILNHELRTIDQSEPVRCWQVSCFPICDQETITGAGVMVNDITQTMGAIGELVGGVAHEFNNLLTVITGYADHLIAQASTNRRDLAALVEIEQAAQRGTVLTERLSTFVKQSCGHFKVYSLQERGTTRRERVPIPPKTLPDVATEQARSPLRETVLLVDDEDVVRRAIKHILLKDGYSVLEAAGGLEALQTSESHDGTIELLISDVVLPGLGGQTLARRILERRPDCKVLFVSGYTNDEVQRLGVMQAEFAFLQKPFTQASLADKVRAMLAGSKVDD